MRSVMDKFAVNGKPLLAPDAEVTVEYTDLDSADSGRDEAGFMHRILLRGKVPAWRFTYAALTEEELRYMESLFPEEATFSFSHPSRTDASVQEVTQCYRSKYGISWHNARAGLWKNYSFTVIAC